ncbi:MAG: alpha-L-fucosidase, partial [Promethearchaeota archaeon]
GANYIILIAKHHDGFCLWPTNTTDYSIKNSSWKNGKGDIIKDFINECKKENIKAGLYLSPWDRHEPCYKDKEAYDKFYIEQLTELLTWYDYKYVELWFDGAGSVGREYDWKSIMEVIQEHQPQAVIFNMGKPDIRWAGNENGIAPYPLWNLIHVDDYLGLKEGKSEYFWLPHECDMPIRYHTWFFHPKTEYTVSPLEELVKCYLWSVGRGANLLLNLAPDKTGMIPEADVKAAKVFGAAIKEIFSTPIARTAGKGNVLELKLNLKPREDFNCIRIQEDIKFGQRVRAYSIKAKNQDGTWQNIVNGSTIGHKKIDIIQPINPVEIKLEILSSFDEPIIKTFEIYSSPIINDVRHYIEDDFL